MFYRSVLRTLIMALLTTATGPAGAGAAGTVELISRADPFPDSNGPSGRPAMSADGRYVAFQSDAPNLVPGQVDENFFHDVFLHDRVTGTTTLVSHAAGSPNVASRAVGFYYLLDVQMSADGRYMAFTSLGIDLVPGVTDSNEKSDVFLYDRVTGTTTLVSHAAGSPNVPANSLSYGVQLSADGKYLAFTSRAKDLVAGQNEPGTNFIDDVFLWDRASNTSTLVSRSHGTTATVADEISSATAISADGDFVLFTSRARDLVPNVTDTFGSSDVFLYQRSSRTVTLVSHASGAPGTAVGSAGGALFLGFDVVYPVLSADGRYVAFASRASNLVPGQVDGGESLDAFLFDRISGEMRLVSHASTSPQLAGGELANAYDGLAISGDGRNVAFVSRAANLVPGQVDTNQHDDVFVYDRVTGTTALASHTRDSSATATAGMVSAGRPSLSADGRFLAFASGAADLVSNQTDRPATEDVFLFDPSTQGVLLVSRPRGSATTAANGDSTAPVISADGGVIGFLSTATDLGEGQFDPNHFYDLFLYRRASAEITSPSRRDPGLPAVTPYGPSVLESLSADGRYAVFSSRAAGLVPGQIDAPDGFDIHGEATGTWDVFLRDTVAGKTTLLSRSLTSKLTAVGGSLPVLSADGRFAAFAVSQLSPDHTRRTDWLYLYDRLADTLTLVNHKLGSATEPAEGLLLFGPSISADGRFLAYTCNGCALVPGYSGAGPGTAPLVDVFLYDRTTGTNALVSHVPGSASTPGDRSSGLDLISADGRFVVFSSAASNLVPGQILTGDLFVFDRTTGAVALATRAPGSAATATGTYARLVSASADGRFIAFQSRAANLVPGQVDTNESTDLFLHDRITGTTVLVSHAASPPFPAITAGNGASSLFSADPVSLSADGRFLVYESLATDLVTGVTDANGTTDAFLYDRLSGTNTLVSAAGGAPGRTANQGASDPRISADGSRVAFLSASTDLIPGQAVPTRSVNLFVRNRSAGTTALVGRVHTSGDPGVSYFFSPRLSAGGRRVAFLTDAPFVQGDFNADFDVYLWKDGTGTPGGPTPLPPCTLLDTHRRADRPVLMSNVQRTVTVRGACGVPATAKQVLVKVTVFSPSGKGNLRFYPGAVTATPSGILRFERGATRTETFTLSISTNGTLTILPFVAGKGTVHGAVEVNGYYE